MSKRLSFSAWPAGASAALAGLLAAAPALAQAPTPAAGERSIAPSTAGAATIAPTPPASAPAVRAPDATEVWTALQKDGIKTKESSRKVFSNFTAKHIEIGISSMIEIQKRGEHIRHYRW